MSEERETALVKAEPIPMGGRGLTLRSFDELQRFCLAAIDSGYFKGLDDVAQAIIKIQYGAELGIPPISALQGVYIVDGRPSLSAGLIAARIMSSGVYRYRVVLMDDERCELEFFEGAAPVGRSTFTLDDAKTAGVSGKDVWRKYPRNMLFARALSNGARWYCPDVFMGAVYTPEELGSDVIDVPRQPAPQPPAPKAPTPVPKSRAPYMPSRDSKPAPDEETSWGAAAEAAERRVAAAAEQPAVQAVVAELGAKVEDVRAEPKRGFWETADALISRALAHDLLFQSFDERDPRKLTPEQRKQAMELFKAEAAKHKAVADT